jgi:DNA-binding MarR family transcriptional regulator
MSDRTRRSVAEEIGQRRPFTSAGEEAMVGLLRTADVIRWTLGHGMAPAGLTLQQYNVLRILRGAGADGLPTLEIGNRMVERQPGVTRLVDRLIAKGLVQRTRSESDRRVVRCSITPEGGTVLADLDGVVREADKAVRGALGEPGLAQLIDSLDLLRAALRTEE